MIRRPNRTTRPRRRRRTFLIAALLSAVGCQGVPAPDPPHAESGAAAAVGQDHDMGGTTGFLMIRGISDLVEEEEEVGSHSERGRNPQRDLWKEYAADVAASFAVGLIESNWPD